MIEEQLAAVFTEWARQYQEDPSKFDGDAMNGEVLDYGTRAARAFLRIQGELAAG